MIFFFFFFFFFSALLEYCSDFLRWGLMGLCVQQVLVAVQQLSLIGKRATEDTPNLEAEHQIFELMAFLNFDMDLVKPGCAVPVMTFSEYMGVNIGVMTASWALCLLSALAKTLWVHHKASKRSGSVSVVSILPEEQQGGLLGNDEEKSCLLSIATDVSGAAKSQLQEAPTLQSAPFQSTGDENPSTTHADSSCADGVEGQSKCAKVKGGCIDLLRRSNKLKPGSIQQHLLNTEKEDAPWKQELRSLICLLGSLE
jgi:hypothetical protein